MKANELRIGNLVQYGVLDVPVKSIHIESVLKKEVSIYVELNEKLNHYCVLIHDVSPIPLTEKWLLKFGFQARYTIGHSAQYYINENPVTHDWMLSILWLEGDNCPFYKNGHHKIKYVHQLQNLYFALTGDELTYTQP